MIAKAMAKRESVVDEPADDALFAFRGKADEGRSSYSAEKSPSGRHFISVAFRNEEGLEMKRAASLKAASTLGSYVDAITMRALRLLFVHPVVRDP
jgi:hypothetical protein